MIWGYYASPMMYGQNAIVMNEFLDERWSGVRYFKSSFFYAYLISFAVCSNQHLTHDYPMQPNPDTRINASTVGEALLKTRGFFTEDYWFWICVAALFAFSFLFNILFIGALTFLNR